jgi:hypothetical protein
MPRANSTPPSSSIDTTARLPKMPSQLMTSPARTRSDAEGALVACGTVILILHACTAQRVSPMCEEVAKQGDHKVLTPRLRGREGAQKRKLEGEVSRQRKWTGHACTHALTQGMHARTDTRDMDARTDRREPH